MIVVYIFFSGVLREKKSQTTMQGASKKQKDVCACVCVFHLGVVFVYLANLCIVGIQSS